MNVQMRFGIVTDYYGVKTPVEKALQHLAGAGIKDVEMVPGHLVKDNSSPPSAAAMRKKLRDIGKTAVALGINIRQVHGPYGGSDLVANSDKERKKNVDTYKKWIDYCLALKSGVLIVHIGGRNDLCRNKNIHYIREKNIDSLFRMTEYIGNENLKLAIENLPGRCMESPSAFSLYGTRISDLKELIKALKSDSTGICLDIGHANIENLDIPLSIKQAGENLIATHIQENNGVYDMHMFPFSLRPLFSRMDWFSIFRAFKEIHYTYPLIGECANSSGELPLWMLDKYLKSQKRLIEEALKTA